MIPKSAANLVGEYIKFSPREMMDLAYVGVAVALISATKTRVRRRAHRSWGRLANSDESQAREAALEGQVLTEALAEKAGRLPRKKPNLSAMCARPPIIAARWFGR